MASYGRVLANPFEDRIIKQDEVVLNNFDRVVPEGIRNEENDEFYEALKEISGKALEKRVK